VLRPGGVQGANPLVLASQQETHCKSTAQNKTNTAPYAVTRGNND
jgi:hypothetical protein